MSEMGVRSGVSTWGFLKGLVDHAAAAPAVPHALYGLDLSPAPPHYEELQRSGVAKLPNLECSFRQGDALHVQPRVADILFIDTLHVFGQLRRELARHAPSTKRFIIMHDTTVDETHGEALRCGFNVKELSKRSGIPKSELVLGLWPAVEEFLCRRGAQWKLRERFTHNNGLTILERYCDEPAVRPVSFALDIGKFSAQLTYDKDQAFCGVNDTAYSRSFFAETEASSSSWDNVRYYDAIAAGCVPFIAALDTCPDTVLTTLPRALILEAMRLDGVRAGTIDFDVFPRERYYTLRDAIWQHATLNCTTYALGEQLLNTVAPHVKTGSQKVLFLGSDARPDCMRCGALAGLMAVLGPTNVVDHVHVPHIYTSYPVCNPHMLRYGAASYVSIVPVTVEEEALKAAERSAEVIERNIAARAYALVVYGSVHRGLPFLDAVTKHYAPSEVIALCGESDTELQCVKPFATWFKRELVPLTAPQTVAFYVHDFTAFESAAAIYRYADSNETVLRNVSVIICRHGFPCSTVFAQRFSPRIALASTEAELAAVLQQWNARVLYTQTEHSQVVSSSAVMIQHCGRRLSAAAVLPYIVSPPTTVDNWRATLNIPADAVVFGWLDTCEPSACAVDAVKKALALKENTRNQKLYLLVTDSCKDFPVSESCMHVPLANERDLSLFVQTCDALIHSHAHDETFGLVCGTAAVCGKPVFIQHDTAPRVLLGDMGIIYRSEAELLVELLMFDARSCAKRHCLYSSFTAESVMRTFSELANCDHGHAARNVCVLVTPFPE